MTSEIDTSTPNVGRMYDYYLGGKNNFPADREAGQKVVQKCPEIVWLALENRRVLSRMVTFLAEQGVRQFIDLGAGMPTQGHVHEVLSGLGVADDCRVVYVDDDPVVQVHAQAHFANGSNAVMIAEDLRKPQRVLGSDAVQRTLDFGQPIAVLMFAVLHFVSNEEDPARLIRDYMAETAPGSYLAYTHVTDEFADAVTALQAVYAEANHSAFPRSPEEIEQLATDNDLEILDPGVVRVTDWCPPDALRPPARQMWIFGGIAQKNDHNV